MDEGDSSAGGEEAIWPFGGKGEAEGGSDRPDERYPAILVTIVLRIHP